MSGYRATMPRRGRATPGAGPRRTPTMPPSPEPARRALIAAGERLFAERGIDNVSLREISRASGARNAVALQHHFGDRNGLLQAILDKHEARVDARRMPLLDEVAALPEEDERRVRALAAALVLPEAAALDDADGGPEYRQITAEVLTRERRPRRRADGAGGAGPSMERWRALVAPLLPPDAAATHRRFGAVLYVTITLARRAKLRDRPESPREAAMLTSSMVDVVEGMLRTPVSAATRAHLDA